MAEDATQKKVEAETAKPAEGVKPTEARAEEKKGKKVEAKAVEAKAKAPTTGGEKKEEKELLSAVKKIMDSVVKLNPDERAQLGLEIIKNLTVMELSGWVKSLEEEFGVSAAPVAVGAAAELGGAAPGAAPAAEEKTEFTVVLVSSGEKKIQVIKEVRALTSLGLKEAKDLVDNPPKPVKEGIPKKEAEEMKNKLEAQGAKVELK